MQLSLFPDRFSFWKGRDDVSDPLPSGDYYDSKVVAWRRRKFAIQRAVREHRRLSSSR